MQYPYTSIYPDGIDEQTFFCDVSIETKPFMDTYNDLIKNKQYTDANIFFSQQRNLHGYSADLFNFMEAKIYNTQEHVLSLEKYNPFHTNEDDVGIGEFLI